MRTFVLPTNTPNIKVSLANVNLGNLKKSLDLSKTAKRATSNYRSPKTAGANPARIASPVVTAFNLTADEQLSVERHHSQTPFSFLPPFASAQENLHHNTIDKKIVSQEVQMHATNKSPILASPHLSKNFLAGDFRLDSCDINQALLSMEFVKSGEFARPNSLVSYVSP